MNAFPKKDLYRPDEVAVYFSVSRATIYRWVNEGVLRATKTQGIVRIPRSALSKAQKSVK